MNRPLRWKGTPSAAVLAACGMALVGPFAAHARADADTNVERFCHNALAQASAAKRSVEGMVTALDEAADRVEQSTPAEHDATLERAQLGIRGLRAAAARQLQTSADNIEEDSPAGLSDDWQELADQLVGAERDLADTILYKGVSDLKPAVDNLNQTSIAFFSRCEAEYPNYPHADAGE